MTDFDDLFAEVGTPILQETFGESVTFRGLNIDNLTVTAIVSVCGGTAADNQLGLVAEQSRLVRVVPSDIGNVGDWHTVVIGEEEWAIVYPPESQSAAEIAFRVTRQSMKEVGRLGYRGA